MRFLRICSVAAFLCGNAILLMHLGYQGASILYLPAVAILLVAVFIEVEQARR